MTVLIDGRDQARRQRHPQPRPEAPKLYKKRTPIYPKLVHGPYRRLKWGLLFVTLGIYYVTPWIRWPRPGNEPQQAVLVDFAHSRFYFFFIHLWPDEVHFITGLLVIAALSLFLATAVLGRVWCGYSCPQTVWTDLYIVVERAFEGDRNARMRLDSAPWSLNKLARKVGKHAAWLIIAMATGGVWIFYFHDAPTVWRQFFVGQAPATAYIFFSLLTATTYILAGSMREQVCTYMCPWPRIQGAMIDKDSLQVTYRYDRGEPRGSHKHGAGWNDRGDCVDCSQCVTACPMGIDIRNGSQLECINCALCIDACDEIMAKVERPKGLIAFDTDEAVAMRDEGKPYKLRLVRSRTLFYGVALFAVTALFLYGLATRPPIGLDVIRDRSPLFIKLHDGAIRNGYTLQIANRTFEARTFVVHLSGLKSVSLRRPGQTDLADGDVMVVAEPDQVTSMRLFAIAPAASLSTRMTPIQVVLSDVKTGKQQVDVKSVYVSDAGEPL